MLSISLENVSHLGAVHNYQCLTECTRHTLLGEGGSMHKVPFFVGNKDIIIYKKVDSIHFQHFTPFLIIFMANYPFEKC